MAEAIGGYFELELGHGSHPYPEATAFNSGRSAFQSVLLARAPRRVWLPHFICSVMSDAALAVNVELLRYDLDTALELAQPPAVRDDELLLYVDYFGLKTDYVQRTLAPRYADRLVVDNSQALFSSPAAGIATLYSPRKFVGVPDGGWLLNGPGGLPPTPAQSSVERLGALIGRMIDGPEAHYQAFQASEAALGREGLQGMSKVTERLLASVDYQQAQSRRTANFARLHAALEECNRFAALADKSVPALCYPLLLDNPQAADALRCALLEERIFVPCYWREVIENEASPVWERNLSRCLLPLPIDQRYDADDMQRLASRVLDHLARAATRFE
jgi:hypothetical protein